MRRLFSVRGGVIVACVATAVACATGTTDGTDGPAPVADAGADGAVSQPDGGHASGSSGGDAGGSSSSGGTCTGKLVINEVMTTGAGDVTDEEFIELYNGDTCDASLAGLAIKYRSSSNVGSSTPLVTFANGASVPPKGFVVIGTSKFSGTKQVTMTGGMKDVGGQIALVDSNDKVVDALGWGTATGDYVEGKAATDSPAGKSMARKTDGVDTNNNANDFAVASTPTPGKSN